MDNEIKPTWRLAWGLWWRTLLISLGVGAIATAVVYVAGYRVPSLGLARRVPSLDSRSQITDIMQLTAGRPGFESTTSIQSWTRYG